LFKIIFKNIITYSRFLKNIHYYFAHLAPCLANSSRWKFSFSHR